MSPARHLLSHDYDERALIECPKCHWHGAAGEADREYYHELFDVSCPRCETTLLLVGYPTIEETRAAAEAGNPKALKALESVERVEEFWRTFEAKKLRASDQLPELEGDALEFVWDCVGDDSRPDTEIRLGDRIIWTEPALWKGKARLKEVEALLAQRYGSRFRSLTPTQQSWLWLLGD